MSFCLILPYKLHSRTFMTAEDLRVDIPALISSIYWTAVNNNYKV